jgi:Arc/MetJ family transcription regulator
VNEPTVQISGEPSSRLASGDADSDEETVMRTTVTLDDATVARAAELTGLEETSALVREGLETLIRVESARRLAALGGTDKKATAAPRRRSA